MLKMATPFDVLDVQFHIGPGGFEEVLASMNALGIKSALLDECWLRNYYNEPHHMLENGELRPTNPTAELAAQTYPDRFAWLLRIGRRDPEYASIIKMIKDSPNGRAIRLSPGMLTAEVEALAGGGYDHILGAACECGLPVFIYVPDRPEIYDGLAQKFPELKIVIDHCGIHNNLNRTSFAGLPALSPQEQSDLFDKVLALSKYPNLGLKWAHFSENFDEPYPSIGTRPMLRKAISAFGSKRIMWASDYSVIQTGETWAELLYSVRNNSDLSGDELADILGRTARTWLDWPLETE